MSDAEMALRERIMAELIAYRCEVCRPEPATIHNQLLTHCKNGHEFNQENTYFAPWGNRICRICRNARRRTAYAEGRPT